METETLQTLQSLTSENHSVVQLLNEVPSPSENRYVRRFLWTPLRNTAPRVQDSTPKICQGEDSRVTSQKRKIGADHPESPTKRQRGSSELEPIQLAVETVEGKGTKRKASTLTQTPSKKLRAENCGANTDKPTEVSVEGVTETGGLEEALEEDLLPTVTPKAPTRDSGCEVSPSPSSHPSSHPNNRSLSDPVSTSRANFEAEYLQLEKLGEGGFGSVYAGVRKYDCLPVAIKHIPKSSVKYHLLSVGGMSYSLPLEVHLMLRVTGGPDLLGQSAAVTLLDWFDLDQELLLVMERPVPCMDLLDYINNSDSLTEDQAKNIMKQLVEASIQMHSLGVFHRDIKTENVLIETSSDAPRVRIIDFGCGCFIEDEPCRVFSGTWVYVPPEYLRQGTYEAGPTTVWQLGALLHDMLGKQFITTRFLRHGFEFDTQPSPDCLDLLTMCLAENPEERATLEEMKQHPWFRSS